MSLEMEMQRVEKLDSPLLVIGLGGTGAEGVLAVKELFKKRYVLPKNASGRESDRPRSTEYLVVDSASVTGKSFDSSDFVDITVTGLNTILNPSQRDANLFPYEKQWVHNKMNAVSDGIGAGTRRQASRLMLFRNFPHVMSSIKSKMSTISRVERGAANPQNNRMEVVIIAGICGGTGSGIFLDVAQIVRYLSQSADFQGITVHITGYIIMPDVNLANSGSGSGSDALESVWKANAFAALKELDFWMNVGEHRTPYVATFPGNVSIKWEYKPFDQCVLMSGVDKTGTNYTDPMKVVMSTLAENLLHYLSYEPSEEGIPYTFIQHEDNIGAALEMQTHDKPVGHFYRIVGAYSCYVPKKRIINYEGQLVLDSFMPPQNEFGQDVLYLPLMASSALDEAADTVTGNLDLLMKEEINRCAPPPDMAKSSPDNTQLMNQMRNQATPLHNVRVVAEWRKKTVEPGVTTSADLYYAAAWERFKTFAQKVIKNKQQGPASLYAYLTDENQGLLMEMRKTAGNWRNMEKTARGAVSKGEQNCNKAFSDFQKPSLIEQGKMAIGISNINHTYMQYLKSFYMDVRKEVFCRAYADRLEQLIMVVSDYASASLKPICDALRSLQMSCKEAVTQRNTDSTDMVDFTKIQNNVKESFKAANENDTVTLRVLQVLSEESLQYENTHAENGAGVVWRFTLHNVAAELSLVIERQLEDTFGAMHSTSAEAVTEQVYQNEEQRQEHISEICKKLTNNAFPLYKGNNHELNNSVKYAFVSIPNNAPTYAEVFRKEMQSANIQFTNPKMSSVTDQIYCLISWDGVPLSSYSLMEKLEEAYEDYCARGAGIKGIQLVQKPDNIYGGSIQDNWTRLPSPKPFYMYLLPPGVFAENGYKTVQGIAQAALEAGNLTMDDSTRGQIHYSVRTLYHDASQTTLKPSEVIVQECDQIYNGTMSVQEKDKALQGIQNAAITSAITSNDECAVFQSNYPAIRSQPIDPWAPGIQADSGQLEIARNNHRTLAFDQVVFKLAQNPRLVEHLQMQTQGFAHLKKRIAELGDLTNVWQKITGFSSTFVDMVCYGVLSVGFGDYIYQDFTVNTQALLANAPAIGVAQDTSVPESLSLMRTVKVFYDMSVTAGARPTMEYLQSKLQPLADPSTVMSRTKEEFTAWLQNATQLKKQIDDAINLINFAPPTGMDATMKNNFTDLLGHMNATVTAFISNCSNVLTTK